jgi:hypothetical protein
VRLLAAVVAAVLATVLLPASPAGAVNVKVDKRLFGVHDGKLSSLSRGVGSLRLWDAGTTWRDIETAPGVYNFAKLDGIVGAAAARGVEVTLVLGMTPDFYAGGKGPTAMPTDEGAWVRYIQAVVSHYKNWNNSGRPGIAAYQVWNEANVINFWSGSPAQLGRLTSLAFSAVNAVDSSALVIGPGMATRLSGQVRWLGLYYYQRVSGTPIWKRMDAIALHLYPMSTGTPETAISQYNAARKQLRLRGVPDSKPYWVTEINYGAPTGSGGDAKSISSAKQAAYVIRTYLLNASRGAKRIHWYAWDMGRTPGGGTRGSVLMTDPDDGTTVTAGGRAFALVRGWMLGTTMLGPTKSARPCAKNSSGLWTCVLRYGAGVRRVYWHPSKRVKVTTAKSATFMVRGDGTRTKIKGGSKQYVGYLPLMVRSRR